MDNSRLKVAVEINDTTEEYSVDLGEIQSTKTQLSPDLTKSGIPSLPSQGTFIMDKGVIKTLTQSFVRVPKAGANTGSNDGDPDSTKWSNGYWIKFVKRYLVNRWQTKTDGCKFSFDTGEGNDPKYYPPIEDINVYISSFTHSYVPGAITGSIQMIQGTYRQPDSVAQHLVIYNINVPQDASNMVYVTDDMQTTLKPIPSSWVSAKTGTGPSYVAVGWCKNSDGSGTIYPSGSEYTFGSREAEVEFYAIYQEGSQ